MPQDSSDQPAASDEMRLRFTTSLLENILLSATEFAIVALDLDFNVMLYNPTAEWMFHCPAKRALACHISEVHSQGGAEVVGLDDAIEDVAEHGKGEYIIEWEQADLPRQYVRGIIMPMSNEVGKWTGYTLIAEDVTVLKQTERAIKESAEKFRLTFENATDAIFWINPDTDTIINCNKTAEKLLQRTRYAIIGRPHATLYPGDRAHDCELAVKVATKGGGHLDEEVDFAVGEGQTVPVRLTASLTHIGPTPVIQAMARDISAHRSVEKSLREAKASAERASRMKSQFLANVSHEIRTPLNGVIGFAEGILAADSLQTAQGLAETILRESEHLVGLINTLLDHAKIEAGKLELKCLPFAIDDMLETVLSSTHSQAWKKHLDLRVEVDGDVPLHVLADPMRLRQILLNLVNNAIKFTEHGQIVIRVESVILQDDWATVRFCVTDTGIGIPPERQDAVFEGFTQVDGSTARKSGGTGLGLTICKEIVGLMGGEMGLDSEVGKGSTFWFTVDVGICRDLDAGAPGPDNAVRDAAIPQTLKSRANILVAEDYPTNQEVVRIHLTAQGHRVTVAEHGKQALALCHQQQFDMIIMDVQMPEMDGLEATRRIRADVPGYADTPVVALTANGEIDTRLACMEAGMNDVVTKPVRRATLLAALSAWLGRDEQPEDLPQPTEPPTATDTPATDISEQPSVGPPMDYDEACREFAGNRELLDKVLTRFVEQARTQLQVLHEAVQAGDATTLQAEAHKLKGGASNLTANALAGAARELDVLCKAGEPELQQCRTLVGSIADEFDRLTAFLAAMPTAQAANEGHAT
ncbi:MAG: response regulator [Planctomycetes bacterium]|nr:response regulator [Planctomycetota bacterium]